MSGSCGDRKGHSWNNPNVRLLLEAGKNYMGGDARESCRPSALHRENSSAVGEFGAGWTLGCGARPGITSRIRSNRHRQA